MCFNTQQFPGCTGALAREVARVYPSASVTVFDLPQVVETAQKHFSQDDDTVVFQTGEPHTFHRPDSCCFRWIHANKLCLAVPAGDFFSGEIPPADLYILARIIHDWPEEKCLTLLKKICNTCKPGYCTHAGVCLYPRTRCLRCHESRATMSQRSLSLITCCE